MRAMFKAAPACEYFGYGVDERTWSRAMMHVNLTRRWACVEGTIQLTYPS